MTTKLKSGSHKAGHKASDKAGKTVAKKVSPPSDAKRKTAGSVAKLATKGEKTKGEESKKADKPHKAADASLSSKSPKGKVHTKPAHDAADGVAKGGGKTAGLKKSVSSGVNVSSAQTSSTSNGARAAGARAGKTRASARLIPGLGRALEIGEAICREVACEALGTSAGYCRLHYIKNWKKVKRKEQILSEGRLNQYIEELVAKYPDKYIEAIRQDLSAEKDFAKVVADLDLDESVDEFAVDEESDDNVIDTIKREFEEETEGF